MLQDVHWSGGGFGYFPTYSLGNIMSVQIWEKVLSELPDLHEQFEHGEFGQLHEWLRTNLYALGRKFTPQETLERVVGGPIDAGPYIRYLKEKLATLAAAGIVAATAALVALAAGVRGLARRSLAVYVLGVAEVTALTELLSLVTASGAGSTWPASSWSSPRPCGGGIGAAARCRRVPSSTCAGARWCSRSASSSVWRSATRRFSY